MSGKDFSLTFCFTCASEVSFVAHVLPLFSDHFVFFFFFFFCFFFFFSVSGRLCFVVVAFPGYLHVYFPSVIYIPMI